MGLIPVVYEFSDILLTDLSRVPPNRDIDYAIDLQSSTKPLSITLYHMDPAKLK